MNKRTVEESLDRITGLAPAITIGCRILIVGSFPSSLSLLKGEYYANPRNDFWKIMEVVMGISHILSYPDRILSLNQKKIGLWDVIQSCIRPGSADVSIRYPEPAPIGNLLLKYSEIKVIICNGRMAESGICNALQITGSSPPHSIQITYLPSTSPAHAIPFADKCSAWMILRNYLLSSTEEEEK